MCGMLSLCIQCIHRPPQAPRQGKQLHSLPVSPRASPRHHGIHHSFAIDNKIKAPSNYCDSKVDLGECNIKLCHSLGKFLSFHSWAGLKRKVLRWSLIEHLGGPVNHLVLVCSAHNLIGVCFADVCKCPKQKAERKE